MRAVRFGAKAAAALLLLLILILAGFRLAAARREGGAPTPAGISLIETRYGRIAVALSGPADGPPILLVHGSVGWSGFWRDVSAHLAERGWRVIAVDLPPFGWSERDPAGRYDRVSEAERLADLLGHVAKRPAVIVGHSFGGGPATELALRNPKLVRSLVLVDAALGPPDPEPGRGAAAAALAFAPLAQGLTAATVTNPAATGPLVRPMLARKEMAAAWLPTLQAPMRRSGTTAAYAAWLPNLFARDDGALSRRSRPLAAIRVPVALIWGGADTLTPLDQGRRIAGLTRARSFAVLPGLGHIPHIEDPDAFLAALDSATAPDREGENK